MPYVYEQRNSWAATLALLSGIGSFIATFMAHAGWGFILALIALPLGIIGLVMAASPRVSGGVISIIGILISLIGMLTAILGGTFNALT